MASDPSTQPNLRNLSARLAEVQLRADFENEHPEAEAILKFGKFKSRTFASVFSTEKGYVKWCAAHLSSNGGANQRAWLEFIALQLDSVEGTTPQQEVGQDPTNTATIALESRLFAVEDELANLVHRMTLLEAGVAQLVEAIQSSSDGGSS